MLGFKIVKSQTYSDLEWQFNQAIQLINEKDIKIADQATEINLLKSEVSELKNKLHALTSEKKTEDVVLLTDTAETPLVVEKKTKKTSAKKTEAAKPRKRIVHKTEE